MELFCRDAHYQWTQEHTSAALARLEDVLIEEDGQLFTAQESGFFCKDQVENLGDGLFRVTRRTVNGSGRTRRIKLIVQLNDLFQAQKYTMPCVMYDGNEWGDGHSPKGLTYQGQPWVFAYDRMGIPSCTLTENEECVVALFASDQDAASLRTSASLVRAEDGTLMHRIYYPVTEAPVSYSGKNKMTERYDEYLTLTDGEAFTAAFYVFVGKPEWPNYGCAALLERMPQVFPYRKGPRFQPERVWELGMAFLKKLIYPWEGRQLIIAGIDTKLSRMQASHMGAKITPDEMRRLMKDKEYNTYGFHRVIFEMGWAGQGFLTARLMMIDALKHHDHQLLDTAIAMQETWVKKQQENGMILAHYERYTQRPKEGANPRDLCQGWLPETCNLGWGASEMAKIYQLLKENGIEKPEFLRFATHICDFFVEHYSPEFAFGKAWTMEGEPVDTTGSVGGFILNGLLDTYRVTGDKRYLKTAEAGLDFYMHRDLDQFTCTAGALDSVAIDKETAFPFVTSSLDLYELTGDARYLEYARKSAYYFFSWAYQYDALYPDSSDFARYGFSTQGGTAVSAEHHAIDPWGSLLVPEFIRLWKHTGEARWLLWARMMWNQSLLGITAQEGDEVHGLARPLGSQNEGFFQTRWTKYRPDCEERGHFNDWLVCWVSAYRLTALDRLTRVCGEKDWNLLA